MNRRTDLEIIKKWIMPRSRILDLACGDGLLLKELKLEKQAEGYGLEIDPEKITEAISNNVNVIATNLDIGLSQFSDKSFDTVIMTEALQAMKNPDLVLDEMLRVGKSCIVTFPNFGYWRARISLAFYGRMPVTKKLSYQWYNTPNIHFCTVTDFETLCEKKNIRIETREFAAEKLADKNFKEILPNLFSDTAIYLLTK
jgi:methionine biosynthesis protein MetW